MCPDRHLEGAALIGADVSKARREDAGKILSDALRAFMQKMKIPNGLSALGYTKEDIPGLVAGALPQDRVNKLSPRPQVEADITALYENSMTVY